MVGRTLWSYTSCDLLTGEVTDNDLELVYAGRKQHMSDSKSHGGFDNDRATMNHILKKVLGKSWDPALGFQPHEVEGY